MVHDTSVGMYFATVVGLPRNSADYSRLYDTGKTDSLISCWTDWTETEEYLADVKSGLITQFHLAISGHRFFSVFFHYL